MDTKIRYSSFWFTTDNDCGIEPCMGWDKSGEAPGNGNERALFAGWDSGDGDLAVAPKRDDDGGYSWVHCRIGGLCRS